MYYNVISGEKSEKLPRNIEVGGMVYANPSLKECSVIGWRELPPIPKAEAGPTITGISYVQSTKDPLKVEAVVTSKTDAAIAEEKAIAEQVQADAQAQYAADRQAKRDELVALAEKNPAEAIGKLFDMMRVVP